jgi:hypothetical protein
MNKYLHDMHTLAEAKILEDNTDYDDKTNEELRDLLREKGLPVYGTKAELIERLKGG